MNHIPVRDEPDIEMVDYCDDHEQEHPLDATCPDCLREKIDRQSKFNAQYLIQALTDIGGTNLRGGES